jgi:hypothetical protein
MLRAAMTSEILGAASTVKQYVLAAPTKWWRVAAQAHR